LGGSAPLSNSSGAEPPRAAEPQAPVDLEDVESESDAESGEASTSSGSDDANFHARSGREGLNPEMDHLLTANQIAHLMKSRDGLYDDESSSASMDSEDDSEVDDAEENGATFVDNGVGAWPRGIISLTRSAGELRERYAIALIVLAKLRGEGAVEAHHAGALKEMALVDDERVMGPVESFLEDEDFPRYN